MGSEDLLLHLSRAAGLGAYLVLWLDMCLGLTLASSVTVAFLPRWRIGDLHQFTGLLSVGLLATHVVVLVGLKQLPFTLPELLIPFVRQINPVAPLLGISGLYVFFLVSLASHGRRYIGRLWRLVHLSTFAGFALALAHAVAAGPDQGIPWVRALYIGTVAVLVLLTIQRVRRRNPSRATSPDWGFARERRDISDAALNGP